MVNRVQGVLSLGGSAGVVDRTWASSHGLERGRSLAETPHMVPAKCIGAWGRGAEVALAPPGIDAPSGGSRIGMDGWSAWGGPGACGRGREVASNKMDQKAGVAWGLGHAMPFGAPP